MRIRVRLGLVVAPLFLVATFALGQQPGSPAAASQAVGPKGAIAMPADRADDSYAIYSMLMPGTTLAPMNAQQDTWAIAEETVNDTDRNPAVPPQGQLKPPPENPTGFAEAVGDYQSHKAVRVQLTKPSFHISHAFTLLKPEAVATARASGSGGITFFSMVYFDTKHRAALVYMNEWCANLCAAGSWIYLEKHGRQWVRRSGVVVPGA